MADLRLARLPDRTPVKITIGIPPALNQSLADYAAFSQGPTTAMRPSPS